MTRALTLGLLVAALAAAGAAWWLLQPQGQAARDGLRGMAETVSGGPGDRGAAPAAHAPRKCLRGREIVYTDTLCPRGTEEAPLDGGSVVVVPGRSPAEKAVDRAQGALSAGLPASIPHARQILQEAAGPPLTTEQMERAAMGGR